MTPPRRWNATTTGLYLVAALLLANLVALLARPGGAVLSAAFAAERQPAISGGAGLYVMPAQLSGTSWGCYLMDVDRGTLCVYQYMQGSKQLHFVAARSFTNDTRLANFNTMPSPQDIAELVNKQGQALRTSVPVAPQSDDQPDKDR